MEKSRRALHFLLIVALLLLTLPSNSASAHIPKAKLTEAIVYYVKPGHNGNCFYWSSACDLQTALNHPVPPDQIWAAAGTYKPTTTTNRAATFQLKSGVEIYGGFPTEGGEWETRNWNANHTILSGNIGADGNADNSYHVVTGSAVNASAILDGFVITSGNTNGDSGQPYGGGMYNNAGSPTLANLLIISNTASAGGGGMANLLGSNPSLTNVFLTGNSAQFGGGIDNFGSSPILTNVTIYGNSANNGGGVGNYFGSNPTFTNVAIGGNTAYYGGGMYSNSGSPTLSHVAFYDNTVTGAGSQGGGLHNTSDGTLTLTDVIFENNSAQDAGGGIYNTSSGLVLSRVLLEANAAGSGGGMFNQACSPSLTNVTFSGNTSTGDGAGLYNNDHSNPVLTNVTIYSNSAVGGGGGMWNFNQSWPVLRNAIIWGNTPDQIWGNATISHSIVQGGYDGAGNLDEDPMLLPLEDNGGYTPTHALDPESPAIDLGYGPLCPAVDQRGFIRPIDGDLDGTATCDMGAFEFGSSLNGFTLAVEVIGSGSVTKDPDQAGYLYGDEVTLTATANPGWTFAGWSGDASGSDNPLTVIMLGDTNITATFTQNEYTLTVTPIGLGTVDVAPLKTTYHYGDEVTLTPIALPGWSFTEWSGDATGTDNPLTITITSDTSITATFIQDYYTLTVTPIGAGSVGIDPLEDSYTYGSEVTLTAMADPGWNFAGWGGDAGGSDNPLVLTMSGNTNITALFTTNWLFLPMITR